jgi:hypothetical protein
LAERAATRRDRPHHVSLCILNALHFLNAGRQNHNAFLMAIRWQQSPTIMRSITHISQVIPRLITCISQVRQIQWRRVAARPLCDLAWVTTWLECWPAFECRYALQMMGEGGGMANATIIERLG